jgi:hypothetical protein
MEGLQGQVDESVEAKVKKSQNCESIMLLSNSKSVLIPDEEEPSWY